MKPQTKLFTSTGVDNLRNADGKLDVTIGSSILPSRFTLSVAPGNALELVAHELSNEDAPAWKRFADAPPPDGFYWSRFADEPREWSTIVEVEDNIIMFLGSDTRCEFTDTLREYYSQPILPPS